MKISRRYPTISTEGTNKSVSFATVGYYLHHVENWVCNTLTITAHPRVGSLNAKIFLLDCHPFITFIPLKRIWFPQNTYRKFGASNGVVVLSAIQRPNGWISVVCVAVSGGFEFSNTAKRVAESASLSSSRRHHSSSMFAVTHNNVHSSPETSQTWIFWSLHCILSTFVISGNLSSLMFPEEIMDTWDMNPIVRCSVDGPYTYLPTGSSGCLP